ncbi:MAG: GNAT family protein [Actinomycetota bacterium]
MGTSAVRVPPMRGRRVLIRPYRPEELEAVVASFRSFDRFVQPWGPPPRPKLRRRVLRSGRLWRGRVVMAIEWRGRLVGEIQTYRHSTIPPDTLGLGIALFDGKDRGRGLGTDAVRTFTRWILDNGLAERIEAGTRPKNRAMRRVFAKLGWRSLGQAKERGVTWAMYELRSG